MYVCIWSSTDEDVRKSLQPLRVDGGDAAGEVRLRFDHDRVREWKIRRVRVQKILHNPTAYTHTFLASFGSAADSSNLRRGEKPVGAHVD